MNSSWIGTATGHGWVDVLHPQSREIVLEAARWQERKIQYSLHANIFESIAEPANTKHQKSLAQYFTPPDVAFAAAASLPLPCPVLDPSAGKGSLLIAAGYLMAFVHGLRGTHLLHRLYGIEICQETRNALVTNIAQALAPWHGLTIPQAETILDSQIQTADFLSWTGILKDKAVLTNPPYQERARRNSWMSFLEKIFESKPPAITAIVPVAISCSVRAQKIRQAMTAWPSVRALHHEIRPRPLFPGIEQRITLVCLRQDLPEGYETTGFVTHRAHMRASLWLAPTVRFPKFRPESFDKVAPSDIDFHASQQIGPPLQSIGQNEIPIEVWIRISGRYHLVAQLEPPPKITSKWKRLLLPPTAANLLISAFEDGTALQWWRIFGDGRDFPIKRFLKTWSPRQIK